ncbi:MAG TPA: hypothetical protein VK586_00575 [Streptosporangiaceae bacterium]|nr:hypothetical protein [Streptosporangiaceae bacterium]
MGQLERYDAAAVTGIVRRQDGVIGRAQAEAGGMTAAAIRHRIRPDGPWQVVLPGVYLSHRGTMTARQRDVAAFCYAGRLSGQALAVTGPAALAWHRIRACPPSAERVDVLVSPDYRRRDAGFARLHPTAVTPSAVFWDGPVCYAPPARALADAVRQLRDPADVRAVVAAGVQQGKVTVGQLAEELAIGAMRQSAGLRRALAEVAQGVRSGAEADLVVLIRRSRLPIPMLNPRLFVGDELLAVPDAWWPEAGVAAEVDSQEWHLSPDTWKATMARHARMSAQGIIVLHFPPSRIRTAGREVAAEIRSALAAAGGRGLPAVRAVSAARVLTPAGTRRAS